MKVLRPIRYRVSEVVVSKSSLPKRPGIEIRVTLSHDSSNIMPQIELMFLRDVSRTCFLVSTKSSMDNTNIMPITMQYISRRCIDLIERMFEY